MKMSRLFAVVLSVAVLAVFFGCSEQDTKTENAAAPAQGGAINWVGYTEGMAKANEAHKPVMVDFYTTWCKYCTLLEDTTYKDPGVISILNESFVCIKVDAESQDTVMDEGQSMTKADLARKYNVTGYPTIWFFDENVKPIAPLPGYSGPEEFKPVLTFITSGAYGRGEQYADYLESLKK